MMPKIPANLVAALIVMGLAMSPAQAGTWPDEPGSYYLELSSYFLTATKARVPGFHEVEPTPRTTNINARVYMQLHLAEDLVASLNFEALQFYRFGGSNTLRLGDPQIGVAYIAAQGENWTVAPLGRVTLNRSGQVPLGDVVTNENGVDVYAQSDTGQMEIAAGVRHSWRTGPFYFDESIGGAWRQDYPPTVWFDASMWAPLWHDRWSGTLAIIGSINVTDISDEARDRGVLANGVGEIAQYVGFLGRLDYRAPNGWGVGVGIDGAFWHIGYPSAPGFVMRLSHVR